jgi:peroxiredoxin
LRKVEAELSELGFPVIAISPDRPEKLQESRKAESLGYALYSDSRMHAARAFGIAFQLDETTLRQYQGYGLDLAGSAGEDHGQLPVPSLFLVDADRRIRWVYSNPDYKVRPDNAALRAAAREATRSDGRSEGRSEGWSEGDSGAESRDRPGRSDAAPSGPATESSEPG